MDRPPVVYVPVVRTFLVPVSYPAAGPDPRIQHQQAVNHDPSRYVPPTHNSRIPHPSHHQIYRHPEDSTHSASAVPDPRTQYYEAVNRSCSQYMPPTSDSQNPNSSSHQNYRESEDSALSGYESDFDDPAPAPHSACIDPEDLALSDIEEEEELPSVARLLGLPERNAEVEAVAEHLDTTVLESVEGPNGFADNHESGTASNPVVIPSSPLEEAHNQTEEPEAGARATLSESQTSPEVSSRELQLNGTSSPISTGTITPPVHTRPKITILPHQDPSTRIRDQLKITIRVANDSIWSSEPPAGSLSCELISHKDLRPIEDDPVLRHLPKRTSSAASLFKLRRVHRWYDDRNSRFAKPAVTTERGVSYTDLKFDWTVGVVGLDSALVHAAADAAGHLMVTRPFRLEFRLRVLDESGQMTRSYPIWINITVWAAIRRSAVYHGNYIARKRRIFFDTPTDI